MRLLLAGAVLVLDLSALLSIFDHGMRPARRVLWATFVVAVPVIGALGWLRARTHA